MRTILFLLLLIPAVSNAQFKRSATELAKDNIRDYLTQKLFKNLSYQPISFGELTENKEVALSLHLLSNTNSRSPRSNLMRT